MWWEAGKSLHHFRLVLHPFTPAGPSLGEYRNHVWQLRKIGLIQRISLGFAAICEKSSNRLILHSIDQNLLTSFPQFDVLHRSKATLKFNQRFKIGQE